MRVNSLRIQNFRMLRDVALEDCRGLNIFIGPNASGKSTALQALDGLLEGQAVTFTRETPFRALESEPVQLDCALRLEGAEWERMLRAFARIHDRPPPEKGTIDQIQKALAGDVGFRYAAIAPSQNATKQVAKQLMFDKQTLDGYLQKLPHEAQTLGASAIGLPGNFGPQLMGAVSLQTVYLPVSRNIPQRFGAAQPSKGRPEELGQWVLKTRVEKLPGFDQYERLVSGILPHVTEVLVNPGQGDFQLALAENDLPGMTPALGWSSGTSHLAMFLGALASSVRGSVLLAEEPELSLHPGALRQLMDQIRKLAEAKQIQFFMTTHSPVVIENLDPSKDHALWRFQRNKDGSGSAIRCKTEKQVEEAHISLLKP